MSMAKNLTERDFTVMEALQWLLKNNPELSPKYQQDPYPSCVISTKPIEEIKLPDGWYYSEKNGITNKHNSTTGIYHCISVEYMP